MRTSPPAATVACVLLTWPLLARAQIPQDIDLEHRVDANRIDLRLSNHGYLAHGDEWETWHDLEYPAGSGKRALFAAGPFVVGRVGDEIRAAAAEYSSSFVPGPMVGGTYPPDDPSFRNYELTERSGPGDPDWEEWPIDLGAPVDRSGAPLLLGNETHWSVYNDADPDAHQGPSDSAPLGVEIRQTTWAYDHPGALANTVFLSYEITNAGSETIEETYFSLWSDPDIGSASGVLGGCDPTRNLGYAYKQGGYEDPEYGKNAPAVGFLFLRTPEDDGEGPIGMSAAVCFPNGADPGSAETSYFYVTGRDFSGAEVLDPGTGEPSPLWYSGDPVEGQGWLMENPGNRKLMVSTGPFSLPPGATERVVLALILGLGADHLDGVRVLRAHCDEIAERFREDRFPSLLEVHPGDLDGNGQVDADDVIPLAVQWGEVGAARRGATLAWEPQRVMEWPNRAAAIADANGDGRVEMGDLFAIGLNWGRIHGAPGPGRELPADLSLYADRFREIRAALGGGEGPFEEAVRARLDELLADAGAPTALVLGISPNPFQQETTIVYRIEAPGEVRASVVDPAGRVVYTGRPRWLEVGTYAQTWLGRDDGGRAVPAGVYFFVLDTDHGRRSSRLVRVR